MDSDDEFDDARLGIGVPIDERYRWIFRDDERLCMLLYEDKIQEHVARFHRYHDSPTPEKYEFEKNMLRIFHQDRLLDTLKGYHQGQLDLAGRHVKRYKRLMKRFCELLGQFNRIISRGTLTSGEETWGPNESWTRTWHEYEFEDPSEWEAFSKRWHVPFGSAYRLKTCLDECMAYIMEHPKPRFQRLRLLDLPVEILERIAASCDKKSLQQLYATCRQLRLLALSGVYTKCMFKLSTYGSDWDWEQADVRDADGLSPYLRRQVVKHRNLVLRQMDSLRQRPDALDRTKDIDFLDCWTRDGLRSFGGLAAQTGRSPEELLLPLLSRLCFFVFRCPLETFRFHSYDFIGILWDAIRSSSTLRTLSVSARVQEDPHDWLRAPSLVNLHLELQNSLGLNMWNILPLCPNLRYLCFTSLEKNASRIPASIGLTPNNVFRILTRVVIQGVQAGSVPVLVRALNAAAAAVAPQPLPLTHFRLDVNGSLLKRDMAFELISALRRSSVQVLYLSKLHYARPDLLAAIARLPNLEALTLLHEQRGWSERRKHKVIWPNPAHEYAAALRDFPKLLFFGFNSNLSPVTHSPFYLTRCEEDYAHAEEDDDAAWEEWRKFNSRHDGRRLAPQDVVFNPRERDYFLDGISGTLPRLFAIYCPTLRLLHERNLLWAFDRRADGKVGVRSSRLGGMTPTEKEDASRMYRMMDLDSWNL